MMLQHGRGKRHGFESGNVWSCSIAGSGAFEEGNVLTVNGESALRIGRRDRAVMDVISAKDALEIGFGRTT